MEEEYNGALREGMRKSIPKSIHYPTNYTHYPRSNVDIPKIEEGRIPARRGKDDRPQDYDSKKKVRGLEKRRTIRKNLNNLL